MATPAAVLDILLVANTKQANAALAKTQAQMTGLGTSAKMSGATMAKGVAAVGVAAGAAATALFKVGEAFDDSYDTIRTKTGATGKELKKLEGSFKSVLKTVPADFETVAEAVGGLNQRLDLTGKPLERLSKQMVQLSKVTGTDIKDNVEATTRLFGDWSVKTDKQSKTLDGLFRISQKTGASVAGLAESMVQFGAPLRNLGFDMEFAAAMFGNFEKSGVNMTTVLSGLRLSVANLADPTDDLAKKLRDLGINAKDPQQALTDVFEAINRLDDRAGKTLGMEVFGRRAGSDIVDAVRTGRFELDQLIKTFEKGDGTIGKAERSTRDFSEQWQIFTNRLAVMIEPAATKFFKLVSDGMKALNKLDLKAVIRALEDFWKKATLLRTILKGVWDGIKSTFQGFATTVKGIVKVVSGVLTGDFRKAWEGVKDIFRGAVKAIGGILKAATAPFRAIARAIGQGLASAFSSAWDKITGIFEGARDALIDIVNWIIENVINRIPGVDLGTIGGAGGGGGSGVGPTGAPGATAEKFAVGGKITKPMAIVGEEAPRHPEFVLATNPAYRKRNLALWEQAGKAMGVNAFAQGGQLNPTDTGGTVLKTAGSYIDKLSEAPFSSLPSFMSGTADFITEKFSSFIKDKVKSIGETAVGAITSGSIKKFGPGSPPALMAEASKMAASFGLSDTSGPPRNYDTYHNPNYRPPHLAKDFSNGVSTPEQMGFAKAVEKRFGTNRILEMFYNPLGYQIDNYARAPMTVMDHYDHVHLAFKKGGVIQEAMKAALKEGGIIGRPIPADLQKYNKLYAKHVSPDYSGETMPGNMVAKLAEFFGMPGVGMAAIAKRESNYRPGAVGDDAAAGYGNTFGYGLWQITSGVGNDSLVAPYGGYENMLNPIANAIVAAKMYAASGFGPWGATNGGVGAAHWTGEMGPLTRAGEGGGSSAESNGGGGKPEQDPLAGAVGPSEGGSGFGFGKEITRILEAIAKLRGKQPFLQERLDNAQIIDAFPSSPMGSDLSPEEQAKEVKLASKVYESLVARAALIKKVVKKLPKKYGPRKSLEKEFLQLTGMTGEGGEILSARQTLEDIMGSSFLGTTPSTLGDEEALERLRQALREANLRTAVSQAQYDVFRHAPVMHDGGVVPGPLGADVPIIAQAGETVTPAGAPTVIINGDIINTPRGRAPVEVLGADGKFKAAVTQATRGVGRRPLPGARGF